jgi:hypothetical protein
MIRSQLLYIIKILQSPQQLFRMWTNTRLGGGGLFYHWHCLEWLAWG